MKYKRRRQEKNVLQLVPMPIEAIDLFCGAGGLTHGLLRAGISVKAGFDIDAACQYAYEFNNPGASFFPADITKLTRSDLTPHWSPGAIRLLAGCAPCQPFSSAANAAKDDDVDPRYDLLRHFTRLVRSCRPELVTMENVPRVKGHQPFVDFVAALKKAKYQVWYETVACNEIGLPQTRRRLVLIASKLGDAPVSLARPKKPKLPTVDEIIGGLPALQAGERDRHDPIHIARSLNETNLARIQASEPGGTWEDWPEELLAPCHAKASGESYKSVYARMEGDQPSPTITTQFFNFGTGRFGHPTQDRAITPREAALLQSFPRRYQFVRRGDPVHLTTLGRMIGNAVPPKLGHVIGRTFVLHVRDVERARTRQQGLR